MMPVISEGRAAHCTDALMIAPYSCIYMHASTNANNIC